MSDKKLQHSTNGTTIDYYSADVTTANDYFPFAMQMPGRKYNQTNSSYRYSINGQEKSEEINEALTTALFWEYDSRIGRRWNTDPIPDISISPYACFNNNPILLVDILGNRAGGPGPKIPNFKIAGLPLFAGDFEFPKIHEIDLEYSKSTRGRRHSVRISVPTGTITLLLLTVEKNKERQQANRDANKAANPTQSGNRATNTAGHEVPYASTQQGGALAMRKITDATQNSNHGTALVNFYKEFNLNTGDLFVVALFEPASKQPLTSPKSVPSVDPNPPIIFMPFVSPRPMPTLRPIPIPAETPAPIFFPPMPSGEILKTILGLKTEKPTG